MVKGHKQRARRLAATKTLGETDSKPTQKSSTNTLKGLFNLGNTCYFNSSLQCLIRSPYFYELLTSHSLQSATLRMPNEDGVSSLQIEMPMFKTPATNCFAELCSMVRNFNVNPSSRAAVDPRALREAVIAQYPRFGGFGQQDSHELLRALLDCIKQEELQRWRKGILDKLNLNLKNLSPDDRQNIRAWGRAASRATLVDRLFGGVLVCSFRCTTCGTIRNSFESFLDLSLPVAEAKPSTGRTSALSATHTDRKSKHQVKRERRKKLRKPKRDRRAALPAEESIPSDDDTEVVGGNVSESTVGMSHAITDGDAVPCDSIPCSDPGSMAVTTADCGVELEPSSLQVDCPKSSILSDDTRDSSPTTDPPILSNPSSNGAYGDAEDSDSETMPDNATNTSYQPDCCAPDGDTVNGPDAQLLDPLTDQLMMLRLQIDSDRFTPFSGEEIVQATQLSQLSLRTCGQSADPIDTAGSLAGCLFRFTSPEYLTGSNQIVCDKCSSGGRNTSTTDETKSVRRDFIRRDLILEPPPLLTIHLKRFQHHGNNLQKCQKPISFPITLDLSPFCSVLCLAPGNVVTYRLYGVVEHLGRLSEGHYVAYVCYTPAELQKPQPATQDQLQRFVQQLIGSLGKPPKWPLTPLDMVQRLRRCDHTQLLRSLADYEERALAKDAPITVSRSTTNDQVDSTPTAEEEEEPTSADTRLWFRCSDSHVTQVPVTAVLSCQPFLLFYERVLS